MLLSHRISSNLSHKIDIENSFSNNINPLIYTIKPNSLYIAYTYGGSGNIKYTKIWLIKSSNSGAFVIPIRDSSTDIDTKIEVANFNVKISSITTLAMGITRIG